MPECERQVIVLPGGVELPIRRIPAGEFTMGQRGSGYSDEEPEHRVVISRDFWLGETPVTQAQFASWTGSDEYADWFRDHTGLFDEEEREKPHRNEFSGDDRLPAERLNWYEAREFCRWVAANAAEVPSGFDRGSLPTEAEWEYACRGGALNLRGEYWNGDGDAALDEIGWFAGNAEARTHPVASRGDANPCGLYDLHGNVDEWCRDRFAADIYSRRMDGAVDPRVIKADVRMDGSEGKTWERWAACLAEVAEGDEDVFRKKRDDLICLFQFAEEQAKELDSWKSVAEASRSALAEGAWPEENVGLAKAWSEGFASAAQGQADSENPPRVFRGGSWRFTAGWCRAAYRFRRRPGVRYRLQGFRLGLFPGSGLFPVNSTKQAESASAGGSDRRKRTPEDEDGARDRQPDEESCF